jgi:membrane protein DedA with SNARE-associated domain
MLYGNKMNELPEEIKPAPPRRHGWVRSKLLPSLSLLAVIAVVAGIYTCFGGEHQARLAGLQQYVYGGAFLISLIGNASIILPVAVVLLLAGIGGSVYPVYGIIGPIMVGLAGGAGAALGETTGYLAGYSGRGIVEKVKVYERVAGWMRRRGGITIFLMAVAPLVFDVVGLAAGSLRYPYRKYLLFCWLGRSLFYVTVITSWALGFDFLLEHFP